MKNLLDWNKIISMLLFVVLIVLTVVTIVNIISTVEKKEEQEYREKLNVIQEHRIKPIQAYMGINVAI